MRVARCPAIPTMRYVAFGWSRVAVRPLDASAWTVSLEPSERSKRNVRSPPADRVGLASSRPRTETSRPSVDSPGPFDPSGTGWGTGADPVERMSPVLGRSSSWPYGSASTPLTTREVPRGYPLAPSGRRTTIPPVPSPMARRRGEPSRPASAVTMPATVTVSPMARVRAAAGVSADGSAVGAGVGVGVGAWGSAWRRASGRGRASAWRWASGQAWAWESGVGVGVGGGVATISSPDSVAWIR